jgi:hypothetical protein
VKRKLLKMLVGFLSLLGLVYLAVWGETLRTEREVAHLLNDLRNIKIGVTTEAEIRALMKSYGGKPHNYASETEITYQIDLESPYVVFGNDARTLPGLQVWSVHAYLVPRTSKGPLKRLGLLVGVQRSDKQVFVVDVREGDELPSEARPKRTPQGSGYLAYHWNGDSVPSWDILHVSLTPLATQEQFSRAFDIQLNCLSSLFWCRNACELNPRLWSDLPVKERLNSVDGLHEKNGPACEAELRR